VQPLKELLPAPRVGTGARPHPIVDVLAKLLIV
jgi:hypothetical protein